MKHLKRIIALILVALLVAGSLPTAFAAELNEDPGTTAEETLPTAPPAEPQETEPVAGDPAEDSAEPTAETDPAEGTVQEGTEPVTEPTDAAVDPTEETAATDPTEETTATDTSETVPAETQPDLSLPEDTVILVLPDEEAQAPESATFAMARAVGNSITVVEEPEWACGEIEYNRFDEIPSLGYPWIKNYGEYYVTNFSYFVLSNGEIGYCIQPYKPGTTGTYTDNMSWGDLTENRQRGVGLALLYGAPNNGDSTHAGYIATAAVVRDMAMGYRDPKGEFVYKNSSNGEMITSSPFGEKLESGYTEAFAKYTEILAGIAKHGTIPSFTSRSKYNIGAGQTITLKYDAASGLYKASATDTNGVLQYFNYSSPIDGLTISKSGNTLNFTATAAAAMQLADGVTMSGRGFEFDQPQDVCTVWTTDPSETDGGDNQLIVVLDAATDPVPSYFELVAEDLTAPVTVSKTSSDGNVSGITFTVTNNTRGTTDTYTTDENGEFSFNVIIGDSITVTEIVPDGYVNDASSQTITVAETGNTVSFENALITGTAQTTKVDAEYPENKLTGATFEVYLDADGDQAYGAADTLYGEMTETEEGVYCLGNLPYGGYFLHETVAPEGFLLDEGYYYFEIRSMGETVTVENEAGVGFINQPGTGELELTKKDVSDGKLLPNAGFRIRNEAGEIVEEGYTDENGVAKFTLRVGKYTYQEFDAPEGYLIDESEYPFEITEDGEIVKAEMTNTPVPMTPQTGDASGNMLVTCGVICLLSLAAACVLVLKGKKNEA